MAWALATARQSGLLLFAALARATERLVVEFKALDIANVAWAFATATSSDVLLFMAMARAAERCVGESTAQDVGNAAWAFGTAGEPVHSMLDATSVQDMME